MQVGSRVRVVGVQAELFPGFFTVSARVSSGVFTLSNGENFQMRFLQEIPLPAVTTYPRNAMPVELVVRRLPMSVWKTLQSIATAGDATVAAGLKKLRNAETINLNAAQTTNWVAYLVTNSFITQAQANLLLA